MWNIRNNTATLDRALARLTVDATNPGEGSEIVFNTLLSATRLWQMPVLASCPLVESYARGCDFVATYEASAAFPFRTQLYWSVLDESPDFIALQLTVSVQTDLLDTHPIVEVSGAVADWPAKTEQTHNGQFRILRPHDSDWSLMLAIHPTDAISTGKSDGNSWPLFTHFLEKGVIRRARLLAAVVPRGHDTLRAEQVRQRFVAAEPPLTT